MNYQFITGVLLARETPVLLDGRSGALARMGAKEQSDPLSEGHSDPAEQRRMVNDTKKMPIERDPKGSDQRQRTDTHKVSRQYATPFFDRRAELVDGPKRNGGTHASVAGAGAGGGRNT